MSQSPRAVSAAPTDPDAQAAGKQSVKFKSVGQSRPLPFQNFKNYRKLPVTDRNLFMAGVAAHYHGSVAKGSPWRTALKYGKRWLFKVPREIAYMVWHHSGQTRKLYGKTVWHQLSEIFRLYCRNGIGADEYYQGGLASVGQAEHDLMVPYWMYRDALYFSMKVDQSHETVQRICSKSGLTHLVREAGFNAPKTLALIDPNGSNEETQFPTINQSFFVKPDRGSQGRHAERWVLQGDEFYLANRNLTVPKHEIISHLMAKARKIGQSLVVQELIENKDAMKKWAGNALSTARIITSLPPGQKAKLGPAMVRVPASKLSSVDNIAHGGMGFHVDAHTGVLALGYSEAGFGPADFSRHSPVTGAEMTGSVVPGWQEATAMVTKLHETLTDLPVIGWDVGFSEDGPTVIEANMPTGINPPDQVKLGGFFTWTVASCMVEHIAIRLKEAQPKGSRLLVGAECPPLTEIDSPAAPGSNSAR
ncbi:MAG: sugar-transfer associated ATP-grasp domain-containing protein [Pseudomonadota bacterium]